MPLGIARICVGLPEASGTTANCPFFLNFVDTEERGAVLYESGRLKMFGKLQLADVFPRYVDQAPFIFRRAFVSVA